MSSAPHDAPPGLRPALRKSLLAHREAFVAGSSFEASGAALARHLTQLLSTLEPESLGIYWPRRSEFNAVSALLDHSTFAKLPIALPFVQRVPVEMHYRAWNRKPPTIIDECGIATSDGAPTVPDVVLAPCVGFTRSGHRLGYGGGYFDRWLARHPHVTSIGVAWAVAEIADADFTPEPHDQAMTLIVTERGAL